VMRLPQFDFLPIKSCPQGCSLFADFIHSRQTAKEPMLTRVYAFSPFRRGWRCGRTERGLWISFNPLFRKIVLKWHHK